MQSQELYFNLFCIYSFIVGACIGSFINVCIWRIPNGESVVFPASHCPTCDHDIKFYENIPILSWCLLRGACSYCQGKISPRYIIIELTTGLLFLLLWIRIGAKSWPIAQFIPLASLTVILIISGLIDLSHHRIPNRVTFTGLIIGVTLALLLPARNLEPDQGGGVQASLIENNGAYRMISNIGSSIIGASYSDRLSSILKSISGIALGGGILFIFREGGKLVLRREKILLPTATKFLVTQNGLIIGNTKNRTWLSLLKRRNDVVTICGRIENFSVEPDDISWSPIPNGENVIQVFRDRVLYDSKEIRLKNLKNIEINAQKWYKPIEVMGMGDVKLMAVVGSFLGPYGVIFVIALSSLLGTLAGVIGACISMIAKKNIVNRSIPYGPHIALAAIFYIFFGIEILERWFYFPKS